MDALKENDWVRIIHPTCVAGIWHKFGRVESLEEVAAGDPRYNVAMFSNVKSVVRSFRRSELEKMSDSDAMLLKLES